MNLGRIQHVIGNFEEKFGDNPMAFWGMIVAGVLVFLIFGGLLLDIFLDRRRERQKAKAVERLHKHLAGLPKS